MLVTLPNIHFERVTIARWTAVRGVSIHPGACSILFGM